MSDLNGKQVLITGGLGFIGSNVTTRMVNCGAEVKILDCLDPNGGGLLENISEVRDKVELLAWDILDFSLVAQAVSKADIVINCAASTSHPFSMREPLVDIDVNSKGVINILESIRRFRPAARLIHLGTTTQVGKALHLPITEDHPEFPLDIYSANKSVSEKYVLIYAAAHGIRGTVLRLSNVFGRKAAIHSPEFTFNNYFIGLALQGRPITVYGEGRQLRNLIYVEDVVDAVIRAIEVDDSIGRTLIVSGDAHMSVADIAKTIAERADGSVSFVPYPPDRKVSEIGDAVMSNALAKRILSWQPRTGFTEGLDAAIDFYRQHLPLYLR
jgi:UDP-glucose 4-epimerase